MGPRPVAGPRRPRARPGPSPRSRWPRTPPWSCPTASRATSTRRPSTTRRTSPTPTARTSAWWTWTRVPARSALRRFIAVDDCGVRINPMIVEGQVHGGLADGVGMALMQVITYDQDGNCLGGSFMDYLLPTSVECPSWELGETVTPCPHHPIGAKGVGESATVGSPVAVVNAVHRRAAPAGRAARGHAAHPGQRVVRDPGPARARRPGSVDPGGDPRTPELAARQGHACGAPPVTAGWVDRGNSGATCTDSRRAAA